MRAGEWLKGNGLNIAAVRVVAVLDNSNRHTLTEVPYSTSMLQERRDRGQDVPTWFTPSTSEAPSTTDDAPLRVVYHAEPGNVRCDPELARLAIGLKHAPQFRLWLILRDICRQSNKNYCTRDELHAAMLAHGMEFCERTERRWLRRGHGLYWELTPYGRIYLIGYRRLSERLTKLALERHLPDLLTTNHPGAFDMYMDMSGTLALFEARVYAAWLASRRNTTIARSTLCLLFNRTRHLLRKWDKLADVTVTTNVAQYHPDYTGDVPDHAYQYTASLHNTVGGTGTERRWRARMSNTYTTPAIRQHPRRGQSRRVHHVVKDILSRVETTGKCEQPEAPTSGVEGGGLQPTGRRYFDDAKRAQYSAKAQGERERYLALGADDGNIFIWDYSPDGRPHTSADEYIWQHETRITLASEVLQ